MHNLNYAFGIEVKTLYIFRFTIFKNKFRFKFTCRRNSVFFSRINITVCMSGNYYGFLPCRNRRSDVLNKNRLSENRSVKYSSYCRVRTFPHTFKIIFAHSLCIGCNCCTFNAYFMLFNCIRALHCNRVIGYVSVNQSQIVIFGIKVYIR